MAKLAWIVKLPDGDFLRNSYKDILYFTDLNDAAPHGELVKLVRADRRMLPRKKKPKPADTR